MRNTAGMTPAPTPVFNPDYSDLLLLLYVLGGTGGVVCVTVLTCLLIQKYCPSWIGEADGTGLEASRSPNQSGEAGRGDGGYALQVAQEVEKAGPGDSNQVYVMYSGSAFGGGLAGSPSNDHGDPSVTLDQSATNSSGYHQLRG